MTLTRCETGNFKDKLFISFDMDWVSDEIIYYCIELILRMEAKATWFITHDSPGTRELFKYPDSFEIGIHPNFLPDSTQGKTIEDVMDYLLTIYPETRIMRTHSLYQTTPMFVTIVEKYPQIRLDVSIFTPYARHTEPHKLSFKDRHIVRIPYIWEDDFEIALPDSEKHLYFDDRLKSISGIKVFDFHPIHIALNSGSTKSYEKLKKCNDIPLVTLGHLSEFRNQANRGVETFLNDLIESDKKTALLKEIGLH